MTIQLALAQQLEKIAKVANEERLFVKDAFEVVARKIAPELEFTADDWIKGFYPSETASIALTERDSDGNIIRTGIAALYSGFPIVIADHTGCYLYEDSRIRSVVAVNRTFVNNPEIPIRCHIFGQKPTPHWVWMNKVIGFLNERGIRVDNNMGPYFVLRNFFFYHKEAEEGIEIAPMKVVISEPFCNKPKEEIGAFIIKALNRGLSIEEQFALANMSGEELFNDGRINKIDGCVIYCASGWIAGARKENVFEVLSAMKSAIEVFGKPENTNEKIKKLIEDLNRF